MASPDPHPNTLTTVPQATNTPGHGRRTRAVDDHGHEPIRPRQPGSTVTVEPALAEVIDFPRHGARSAAEQVAVTRSTAAHAFLAAIAQKYPDIRLTTDELAAMQHRAAEAIFDPAENCWRIEPQRRIAR